jgi:methionine synthase II (cobalamin-independent)
MPLPFRTTVTGSYPRPVQPADTLKKPSLSREESDGMIRWAARDQVDAGLDVITDTEGRRENCLALTAPDGTNVWIGFGNDRAEVDGRVIITREIEIKGSYTCAL